MNVRVPLSITTEMVRTLAVNESVCVRPLLRRVTDRHIADLTQRYAPRPPVALAGNGIPDPAQDVA